MYTTFSGKVTYSPRVSTPRTLRHEIVICRCTIYNELVLTTVNRRTMVCTRPPHPKKVMLSVCTTPFLNIMCAEYVYTKIQFEVM